MEFRPNRNLSSNHNAGLKLLGSWPDPIHCDEGSRPLSCLGNTLIMVRFQIKCFEQEAVVFDTASGDTHYLSPLAYAIYTISREQPGMSAQDIHIALQRSYEVDSRFEHLADEALDSLRHIGLLDSH